MGNFTKLIYPDNTAVTYGIPNEYYEVECGNHKQSEFNAKCNKLLKITPNINIIGRNRDRVTSVLIPQVEHWIKSVGINVLRMISGVTVAVYGMTDFARGNLAYILNLNGGKWSTASSPKRRTNKMKSNFINIGTEDLYDGYDEYEY